MRLKEARNLVQKFPERFRLRRFLWHHDGHSNTHMRPRFQWFLDYKPELSQNWQLDSFGGDPIFKENGEQVGRAVGICKETHYYGFDTIQVS